jgi:DNA polymerase III subunit alpha
VLDVAECRRIDIEVCGPDINKSGLNFQPEVLPDGREAIRFGLSAIKNVGGAAAEAIIEARSYEPGGGFSTLEVFCSAIDWSRVSRRVADSLARCGALDSFGAREHVLSRLESSISGAIERQRAAAKGQLGFDFAGAVSTPFQAVSHTGGEKSSEISLKKRLAWERELLGVYLSDHPVADVLRKVGMVGRDQIAEVADRLPGQRVKIVGRLHSIRKLLTRNNRTMAVVEFEDLTGTIELVVFPDCYDAYLATWQVDSVVEAVGRVDRRGDQIQLVCESVSDQIEPEGEFESGREVHVSVSAADIDTDAQIDLMQEIDAILQEHEGDDRLVIHLTVPSGDLELKSRSRKVEWSDALKIELEAVIGTGSVWLLEIASDPAESHRVLMHPLHQH